MVVILSSSGMYMFRSSPIGYYDLVLMDVRMPEMDGYQAAGAIRAMNRADAHVPIIAMTADAFSEDIRLCLESGMNAHIAKPMDMKLLLSLLQRYLHSKHNTADESVRYS